MNMRRLLVALTIVALLAVPQFALAGDVDDLKAAYAKGVQVWNNIDADGIVSMVYPGMVNWGNSAAFPSVLPMENTQAQVAPGLKQWLSGLEMYNINPYNMQFRVLGNIGLIWGHQTQNIKAKGEPTKTFHLRVTQTWIKSEGKWYIVMNHLSAIPSGD